MPRNKNRDRFTFRRYGSSDSLKLMRIELVPEAGVEPARGCPLGILTSFALKINSILSAKQLSIVGAGGKRGEFIPNGWPLDSFMPESVYGV